MWYYKRTQNEYVRVLAENDNASYIFGILGSKLNRGVWQKICQWTVCELLGHIKGKICVKKGYSKERGSFELCLCDRCRARVLFYEGVQE